jgi:hypothetical protein
LQRRRRRRRRRRVGRAALRAASGAVHPHRAGGAEAGPFHIARTLLPVQLPSFPARARAFGLCARTDCKHVFSIRRPRSLFFATAPVPWQAYLVQPPPSSFPFPSPSLPLQASAATGVLLFTTYNRVHGPLRRIMIHCSRVSVHCCLLRRSMTHRRRFWAYHDLLQHVLQRLSSDSNSAPAARTDPRRPRVPMQRSALGVPPARVSRAHRAGGGPGRRRTRTRGCWRPTPGTQPGRA